MSYPFSPGTGAGKPVEAQPAVTPEPAKPASEGAPHPGGYAGHARSNDGLLPSDRGPLAPAFSKFSAILGKELERDERERRASVREALGPVEFGAAPIAVCCSPAHAWVSRPAPPAVNCSAREESSSPSAISPSPESSHRIPRTTPDPSSP